MRITNKCENCAILDSATGKCKLTGFPQSPNDFCSRFKTVLDICANCNQEILVYPIALPDGRTLCHECFTLLSYCPTCFHSSTCVYETDPSPLPKSVQRRVQNGSMITVIETRNPERIDITCKKSCLCFDEKIGCRRQLNFCNDYKEKWEN